MTLKVRQPQIKFDEYRVVHLSDLHFTGRPLSDFNTKFWKHFHLDSISESNMRVLLEDIVKVNPHHIVITGDITNTAHPDEFTKAKAWLLQLQQQWKPQLAPIGTTELRWELFTIVPGNHDVSKRPAWFARRKAKASRLARFINAFGSTLGIGDAKNIYDANLVFPHHKLLFDVIDVHSVNSTLDVPVHVVGFNAVGKIGDRQRINLAQSIESGTRGGRYRVVACHHHPLTIPYKQEPFDEFLVMRDARTFLSTCFEHRVHLVLHGHKHVPFVWTNQVIPELDPPHQMTVVSAGSPTHERAGSSRIYNRYVVIRRNDGGVYSIESVDMYSRRFDPSKEAFIDVEGKISIFKNPFLREEPGATQFEDIPTRDDDF